MTRPPRILVVDDVPANLLLARGLLAPAGYDVGEARSGAEALAAAQEAPPDLVLLDMHLPDMHGLEVLRRIRESPWGASLPVVGMSALAGDEERARWFQAGCVGAIEKPISVQTFVREVGGFLAGAPQPAAPEELATGMDAPHKATTPDMGLPLEATTPDGDAPLEATTPDGDAPLEATAPDGGAPLEATAPDGGAPASPAQEAPLGALRRRGRLGEILMDNGLISEEQLEVALQAQRESGKRLGQILVEHGAVTEDDIAWALSTQLGYPYVHLNPSIVDGEAVRMLPEALLRERHMLPVLKFGQEMTLAMADPTDEHTVEEVGARTRLQVRRSLALASNIAEMLDHFFARAAPAGAMTGEAMVAEAKHLQFHLVQALQQGASEIHFDPMEGGRARVRYRLQGVLADRPAQAADLHDSILHHLHDMTGTRPGSPGTAAVTVGVGDAEVVLVVTFMPTVLGPAATVVLYPRHTEVPDLEALGLPDDRVRPLRQALAASCGVVLVGCGEPLLRSTLLHAMIPTGTRRKIWSLESLPVYRRPTINRTVLASSSDAVPHLRGAVGAGADLIVVDDASSVETLRAAHEAARGRTVLAGHPQADAVGLLGQAVDALGPALVASTLRGILAARSVHLLCPKCRQPAPRDSAPAAGARVYAPGGCEACGFTGFRGQRVLFDVWIADPGTRLLLRSGRAATVFERLVQSSARMREQGLALVRAGLVSQDELARVAEAGTWTSPNSSS
jgi:type IV pilus assembly protein PilB